MRTMVFFGALLAGLLGMTDAFAEPTPEDRAAADKLFQEGIKLADQGDYEHACPKLEASNGLDPAIGTLMNLGACYERLGRHASAWSSFNACADMAYLKKDKREADARSRAREVEAKLAMFTIEVPAESDAPDLVVRRDGKTVNRELWGVAVPVDPGDHLIEAEQPGRKKWSTTLKVEDKPGPVSARVPKLELLGPMAPIVPPPPTVEPRPYVPFWTTPRILSVNAVGLGFVGIGVGAAFGGDALGKIGSAKDHCFGGTPLRCDADGQSLYSGAKTSALASDIGFIAGGVLLAGGAVLWLVAPGASGEKPKEAQKAASIGVVPGPGGAMVRGEW